MRDGRHDEAVWSRLNYHSYCHSQPLSAQTGLAGFLFKHTLGTNLDIEGRGWLAGMLWHVHIRRPQKKYLILLHQDNTFIIEYLTLTMTISNDHDMMQPADKCFFTSVRSNSTQMVYTLYRELLSFNSSFD